MKALALLALLLSGCASNFERDSTTVMSYCLLGATYIDEGRTARTGEIKDGP